MLENIHSTHFKSDLRAAPNKHTLLEMVMATKVNSHLHYLVSATLILCLQPWESGISRTDNMYFYFNEGCLNEASSKTSPSRKLMVVYPNSQMKTFTIRMMFQHIDLRWKRFFFFFHIRTVSSPPYPRHGSPVFLYRRKERRGFM